MSAPVNFQPVVDQELHLEGYRHDQGEFRPPTQMAEVLDGNERIPFRGSVYRLDERGNLINERVAMPELLTIGYGVLIGAGVEFRPYAFDPRNEQDDQETVLQSGSTIYDPSARRQIIGAGLKLGSQSVLRAAVVGPGAHIEGHTRIYSGTRIGSDFRLGAHSSIGARSEVGDHARLGSQVTIGFETVAGDRFFADDETKIGIRARIGSNTVFGQKVVIGDRQVVGRQVWLPDDFDATRGLYGGREIADREQFRAGAEVLSEPPRRLSEHE